MKELGEFTKADKETEILRECLMYGRECDGVNRFGVPQSEFALQKRLPTAWHTGIHPGTLT